MRAPSSSMTTWRTQGAAGPPIAFCMHSTACTVACTSLVCLHCACNDLHACQNPLLLHLLPHCTTQHKCRRERKEYILEGDVVFRNPAAKAEADAAAAAVAAPVVGAAAPATSAPAAPAAGTFAQMLQPAVGDATTVQAAAPATDAAPGDAAGAAVAAPEAAGDAAAAKAKAANGSAASKRQTLNDIAAIATRQLTENQGGQLHQHLALSGWHILVVHSLLSGKVKSATPCGIFSEASLLHANAVPPPAGLPAVVPAAAAPMEVAPDQAGVQAPAAAQPPDAVTMPMEGVMPAVTMGMPPGAALPAAPMAAPGPIETQPGMAVNCCVSHCWAARIWQQPKRAAAMSWTHTQLGRHLFEGKQTDQ